MKEDANPRRPRPAIPVPIPPASGYTAAARKFDGFHRQMW